jgi:hypothetical protein
MRRAAALLRLRPLLLLQQLPLLLSLLALLAGRQPASAENSTCTNRAHCEYAAPLSKYVCGISTDSLLVAANFRPDNISGTETVVTNATCETTLDPGCDGTTGSYQECTGAGSCSYSSASGDSPATCTTTVVAGCAEEEARVDAEACLDAGGGDCTFTPAVYTDPNTTHPTVFLLCTLGATSGCSGADVGAPECELPPDAVRANLTEVQRTVGDPHLAAELHAEAGLTEAQFLETHGMSADDFAAQTTSDYWKAAIAKHQCVSMCSGLADSFERDCLDINNAAGTIKEATADGSDVCDHRACASSLAAIRQALLYGC